MPNATSGTSISRARQKQIFTGGFKGTTPSIPASFDQLKQSAKQVLSKEAFAYIAGGAGSELTMSTNRRAFSEWQIQPRMLHDVSRLNTSVSLFGQMMPAPFLLAPIGVLEMAHPEADLAVAKAAAGEGIPFIFSSQASVNMEDCAELMGNSPRWFQLYWSKNDKLVKSFVQRAEQCGCDAIVLTLDTTMLGWRPRDLDLAYLPFLHAKGMAQYISDPVFQGMVESAPEIENEQGITFQALVNLLKMSRKYPGSTWRNFRTKKPLKAVKTFIETYSRPSLEWNDLSRLREMTSLPLILKGILHPKDARKAAGHGMDGIIVSNHGGRQVNGAVSSLSVLPDIAKAAGADMKILFDSGIRDGSDIVKALALGADSVLIGRPYAYSLALGGAAGVRAYLRNLRADFDLHMGLSGCTSINDIKSDNMLQNTKD